MALFKKTRQISTSHMIAAAAIILGIMFVVAFGAQVLQAIRLRNWRDRLSSEVSNLTREQADWEQQVLRSLAPTTQERELTDSGWITDDLVIVTVKTAVPEAVSTPTTQAGEVITGTNKTPKNRLFSNVYWYEWLKLIRGFD